MKIQLAYIVIGFTTLSLFACSDEKSHSYESSAALDTIAVSSSEKTIEETPLTKQFPHRKFIRTADIRCEVNDVAKATYTIEAIVQKWGGFVALSQLSSTANEQTTVPISADSVLEIKHFTVNNLLRFRIPNQHFESSLKEISELISYLDTRTIKTNDVSLQMTRHSLTQKRVQKYEKRVDKILDNKLSQSEEGWNQESALVEAGEKGDEAYVENLSLEDQVDFSTVEIYLYQPQGIKREVVPSNTNIQAYEPHFGLKALGALSLSITILEETLLVFLRFWWMVIAAGLVLYYVRKDKIRHIAS